MYRHWYRSKQSCQTQLNNYSKQCSVSYHCYFEYIAMNTNIDHNSSIVDKDVNAPICALQVRLESGYAIFVCNVQLMKVHIVVTFFLQLFHGLLASFNVSCCEISNAVKLL
jgi:hypothetical protein